MNNDLGKIKDEINRMKFHSQELNNQISLIKESSISTKFYLSNLKRLSLQALDLFCAMNRQAEYLAHQKSLEENLRAKQRREHGLSVVK